MIVAEATALWLLITCPWSRCNADRSAATAMILVTEEQCKATLAFYSELAAGYKYPRATCVSPSGAVTHSGVHAEKPA